MSEHEKNMSKVDRELKETQDRIGLFLIGAMLVAVASFALFTVAQSVLR